MEFLWRSGFPKSLKCFERLQPLVLGFPMLYNIFGVDREE